MLRKIQSLLFLSIYSYYVSATDTPNVAEALLAGSEWQTNPLEAGYQPDFLHPATIVSRASTQEELANNSPKALNLASGVSSPCYTAKKATLGVDNGQPRGVFISVNACQLPIYVGSASKQPEPPAMKLYISNSTGGGCPSTSATPGRDLTVVTLDGGAAMVQLNTTEDVNIVIAAPQISSDFSGDYNYEVAISVDQFYHSYLDSDDTELFWLDSDSNSALMVSRNLTTTKENVDKVMKQSAPFQLHVNPANDTLIWAMRNSACGLSRNAMIHVTTESNDKKNTLVKTVLTTVGPGGFPKQEFFIRGLNISAKYDGFLVEMPSGSVAKRDGQVGGGGTVFTPTAFSTTASSSCQIVAGLDFCDEVQYAVPGNVKLFDPNTLKLAQAYDEQAKEMYANFQKVMQNIQCEAESTEKYSLVRNCADCAKAYKKWLCSVLMPRCEDITSTNPYAIVRNAGQPFPNQTVDPAIQALGTLNPGYNASRNSFIDTTIQPGPYRELLPCEDLCYELVQSCPSKIGFACPSPHMPGFNTSYAVRDWTLQAPNCNYPGEPRTRVSGAGMLQPTSLMAFLTIYGVFMAYLTLA